MTSIKENMVASSLYTLLPSYEDVESQAHNNATINDDSIDRDSSMSSNEPCQWIILGLIDLVTIGAWFIYIYCFEAKGGKQAKRNDATTLTEAALKADFFNHRYFFAVLFAIWTCALILINIIIGINKCCRNRSPKYTLDELLEKFWSSRQATASSTALINFDNTTTQGQSEIRMNEMSSNGTRLRSGQRNSPVNEEAQLPAL